MQIKKQSHLSFEKGENSFKNQQKSIPFYKKICIFAFQFFKS